MANKPRYFLGLTIALCLLFILDCASIIYGVANKPAEDIEGFLGIAYLFIHMIALCFAIVFAVKAYTNKPTIVNVVMTLKNGEINPKSKQNSIICALVCGIIGVYFTLLVFIPSMPLSFFSLGAKLSIANLAISVAVVSIFLLFYKPTEEIE